MRHQESNLQITCVNWFSYQYPKYDKLFFAVPNGSVRSKITAKILKAEGVKRGVSDLILLVPKGCFHGLCIEMKYDKNTQNDEQKEFEKQVAEQGYKYVVCYTLTEFMREINNYLNLK
jgi:hypothetical protein